MYKTVFEHNVYFQSVIDYRMFISNADTMNIALSQYWFIYIAKNVM